MIRRAAAALILGLTACTGEGSDIGPRLEKLPDASYRLVVKDDSGSGVASAIVSASGVEGAVGATDEAGRAEYYLTLTGRRRFTVDAIGAAATAGDRLGSLVFAADAQPDDQLPFVVYLADMAGSAAVQLAAGNLSSPITLDDSGWSGAVVELSAGTAVDLGGAPIPLLQTGALRADHIPPLRFVDGLPVLATRGILIEPLSVGFQPSGSLVLPNDFGLPVSGGAVLYRLDPSDGEWRSVGTATVDASGATLRADGALPGGGLYVAAVPAPAVARFIGQVIQEPIGGLTGALSGLRVRAGQVFGLTDGSGRFVLDAVPVADAAGIAAPATIVLAGGRAHRTTVEEFPANAAAGTEVDLGTVESKATFATDVRLLLIERGRVASQRPIAMGSTYGGTSGFGHSDANGRLDLPAMEAGFLGFMSAVPDSRQLYQIESLEGIVRLDAQRSVDLELFYASQEWNGGDGGTSVWPVDPIARASLESVYIFRNPGGGTDEFLDVTKRDQIDREELSGSDAILTLETSIEGQTVRSAFEVQRIFTNRIEAPMTRARRARLGEFVPFGYAVGDVPGAGATKRAFATGTLDQDMWLSAAMEGRLLLARAPVRLDPSAGGVAFGLGVPTSGGAVIATTEDDSQGRPRLRDVAFVEDLRIPPGVVQRVDLGAPLAADDDFEAPDLLVGLDPRVPADSFVFDFAIRMPSGRTLDVARGLDGRGLARGTDVVFALPGLSGPLAGARHLVLWRGEGVSQGVTVAQRAFVPFDASTRASIPLLEAPQVDTPIPGSTVPAAGFDVRYQLPPDTRYVVTTLRSIDRDRPVDWEVLAPSISTGTRFRRMPTGPEILLPGRYTLEVTAVRLERGTVLDQFDQDYQAVVSRWVAIGPATRGLGGMSSVRFEIEIVP